MRICAIMLPALRTRPGPSADREIVRHKTAREGQPRGDCEKQTMSYTHTELIRRSYRGEAAHRHVTAISQHHRIQASPAIAPRPDMSRPNWRPQGWK